MPHRVKKGEIIVDTMSAAAGFTDENSSSEGQRAMDVLTELSKRTGAFVLACDHFGKAVETGTRGSSAKEAAADVVIACLGEKSLEGSVTNTRVAIRKLRGGVRLLRPRTCVELFIWGLMMTRSLSLPA